LHTSVRAVRWPQHDLARQQLQSLEEEVAAEAEEKAEEEETAAVVEEEKR
jgi:hypothetical protein